MRNRDENNYVWTLSERQGGNPNGKFGGPDPFGGSSLDQSCGIAQIPRATLAG